MRLHLSSIVERLRASLFVLPMAAVVVAVASAAVTVSIDRSLDPVTTDLPLGFTSTVESARALLSTMAGATIAFAGIAISVSLLVMQQASSQYSPRVVPTLFRDPFNKRVMAVVIGTFTYCLMVLRAVRSSLEEDGEPVIPNLSVAVAVAFGILTLLAVVAFINHNAHAMDISDILERVTRESIAQIRQEWEVLDSQRPPNGEAPAARTGGPATIVRFDGSGWIQQINVAALGRAAPEGSTITVHTRPGRYAVEGTTLCTISPPVPEPDPVEREIRSAVLIGGTRTMQQDASHGLRQLADVALRALSPGVNDPTTAQDAIFHATAVLAELHRRTPPLTSRPLPGGRWVVLPHLHSHDDLVRLAFEEIRRAAAPHPSVCIYLLEALRLLRDSAGASGSHPASEEIASQAELVVLGCEAEHLLPADVAAVRRAYAAGFNAPSGPR